MRARLRGQGISDEFVPPVLALGDVDEVIPVPDGDAIRMAQKLSRDLGLGVGIRYFFWVGSLKRLIPHTDTVTRVTVPLFFLYIYICFGFLGV